MNAVKYRDRVYGSYLRHFSHRDISDDTLENQRRAYRYYYGRLLPSDKGSKVLEIGCGYGAFLYFLKKEGYGNISGIDVSPDSVHQAKSFGIESVQVADAFSFLNGRKEEFDVIFALDVLEHLTKDELFDFGDAVQRALRKGGRFVVQVPNAGAVFAGFYRYSDLTHEMAFTITTISDVLRICGFEGIEVTAMAPMVGGVRSFLKYLLWRMVNAVLRFYLLQVEGLGPYQYVASVNLIASGRKP